MTKSFLLLAVLSSALLLSGCAANNRANDDNTISNDRINNDRINIDNSSPTEENATTTPLNPSAGTINATNTSLTPSDGPIIGRVGDRVGYFLITKINPDSVAGLQAIVYPVARPDGSGTPRTLQIGDDIGLTCEGISEKLTSLDFTGQTVTFTKVTGPTPRGGCPICLAGNTLIDTPSGSVLVKDLPIGRLIWTTDQAGRRVSGVVTKISKVTVPLTHQMVHLILNDGRELFVSARHPLTDGRNIGDLRLGDSYDNASVVSVQRVSYNESATYDVLPSGETGFYWANGILLGSTLKLK